MWSYTYILQLIPSNTYVQSSTIIFEGKMYDGKENNINYMTKCRKITEELNV